MRTSRPSRRLVTKSLSRSEPRGLLDVEAGAEFHFRVDHGHDRARPADAGVGGGISLHWADVVADAVIGEAHPVLHRRAFEASAFGNGVVQRIGIAVDDAARCIVNFAVTVGAFIDDFFEDVKCAGGSGATFHARADGVVHHEFAIVHEHPALAGEVDFDVRVAVVCLIEELFVFPNVVGFRVRWLGFEMLVGAGRVGVHRFAADARADGFLIRAACQKNGGRNGGQTEERAKNFHEQPNGWKM